MNVRWNRFDWQIDQRHERDFSASSASSHDYIYVWCVSVFQSIWLNRSTQTICIVVYLSCRQSFCTHFNSFSHLWPRFLSITISTEWQLDRMIECQIPHAYFQIQWVRAYSSSQFVLQLQAKSPRHTLDTLHMTTFIVSRWCSGASVTINASAHFMPDCVGKF